MIYYEACKKTFNIDSDDIVKNILKRLNKMKKTELSDLIIDLSCSVIMSTNNILDLISNLSFPEKEKLLLSKNTILNCEDSFALIKDDNLSNEICKLIEIINKKYYELQISN